MIAYFNNIWQSVTSIFEGMAITFSNMIQMPTTVQYPDRIPVPVQETLPDGYRGRLSVNIETCTACGACEKACPIDVIDLKGARTERKKGLTLIYFNIHHGKCMYCNLCVEVCPVDVDGETAIHFTKQFEGSTYDIHSLVEEFVPAEEVIIREKEAQEMIAKRAAEKAAKEQAAQKAKEEEKAAKEQEPKKAEASSPKSNETSATRSALDETKKPEQKPEEHLEVTSPSNTKPEATEANPINREDASKESN